MSLAAGLRLRGIPVDVHEAGSYPRHRVCGEFISGVEGSTFEYLGIEDSFADALHHREVKWFREGRLILENELPTPAAGISRYRLDQRLKDRVIDLGGTVHERSRFPRKAREGLVWAAGRIPQRSSWIGLKCHFRKLAMSSDLEMHLGENGYVGLAGIENGEVNVCGLFKIYRGHEGRAADLLYDYLTDGGNGLLVERLRAAERDDDSFSAVAGFELGRQCSLDELCTIGDAESMIPPFTGNGMSMAFQAAEIAVDPLLRWSRDAHAWNATTCEIRSLLQRRFRRRLRVASTLHPILIKKAGTAFIEAMSLAGVLPFKPLLSLVR